MLKTSEGKRLARVHRLRAREGTKPARILSGAGLLLLLTVFAALHFVRAAGPAPRPRAALVRDAGLPGASLEALPARPKLVIIIIIDQFRPDYLVRFRPQFVAGGFNLLMSGANFVNCRHEQSVTVTAQGHTNLLTGAYPYIHGIVSNEWFDRKLNRTVNCVEDDSTHQVDDSGITAATGHSPHYLVGSTLGDELRAATGFESRVVSISLKDRGAILPGGHTANAAYWYDSASGQFVSSTYYMPALPPWAVQFNRRQPAKAYCGKAWRALAENPSAASPGLGSSRLPGNTPCLSPQFLEWLGGTPFMSEIEFDFAEEAIRSERLGQGASTDLLTVSLSENDAIGHRYGPYSPEVADMILRTDRDLAGFFKFVDETLGLQNIWIALSADHGIAPNPKFNAEHRLGPGHADLRSLVSKANGAIAEQFGYDNYILPTITPELYLNRNALAKHKVPEDEAEDLVAAAVGALPDVEMAVTRHQLMEGRLPLGELAAGVAKSFYPKRSGDVVVAFVPFAVAVPGDTETTHGTPWSYDSQVPLLLWGAPFKPGVYVAPCHSVDLAATLAVELGIHQTSGELGRPLEEALK